MTHFVLTVSNILTKLSRDLEIGIDLSDAINLVEDELKLKDISLGNIVKRWRRDPKLQDEAGFKLLRIEGDKAFQEKKYGEAMKKHSGPKVIP